MFLKTRLMLDIFDRFGKDFSFKQQLNNFTRIRDNSMLIYMGSWGGDGIYHLMLILRQKLTVA